jgi:hypothetical protein
MIAGKPARRGEHGPGAGNGDHPEPGSGPVRVSRRVLEQRVGDDEERESAVPEHVQPSRALRPGTKQAGGREQARERERVGNSREGGEQVSAGQDQQCPGLQKRELPEQQDGGDQIVDDQRRFIDGNEAEDRRQLNLRERHRRAKDEG